MNNKQLDMVLDYLNEGTEIDKDEFLHEGLFQKLKDLFTKKKKPKIEDPTAGKSTLTEQERMKIYNDSVAIAKKVLVDFKKHKEWSRYFDCFVLSSKDDTFEDFKNGDVRYFDLVHYDLWDVQGGKARTEIMDELTDDVWCWVFEELENRIKEKHPDVKVDYWGDWDEGPFEVITK